MKNVEDRKIKQAFNHKKFFREVKNMRKTMRKVLAVVLCLSVLLTLSPLAFAASTTDDGGYNFRGVYRVPQNGVLRVNLPREVLAADDYDIWIENEDIATMSDVDPLGFFTIKSEGDWGATVLSIETYKKIEERDSTGEIYTYYEYLDSYNYVIFVFDTDDATKTGKVTNVSVDDLTLYADEEDYLYYDVATNGEVYYDTIVYIGDYGLGYDDDGDIYAYDRGEYEGILYAVDSNGNIVYDYFTVTVKYTPWQWVKYILRSIIDFLFGWIYN